ncbi:MAG TPA: Na+/H+ antiporter subunit E [Halothiobacillaceae bacterium]|nr:Na+/H+ antiporter subunit E [Halothiobacillaceae bacterium]
MKKFIPQPVLSLVLFVIWLLLNNSIAPVTIVSAFLIALILPHLTKRFWLIEAKIKRPVAFIEYLLLVLVDIVRANFVVAAQVLGRNESLDAQFLKMELDLEGSLPISILASTISLTPGTVSCRVSSDQQYLVIHILHTTDAKADIDAMKQRYEARLLTIFGQQKKEIQGDKEVVS